MQSRRISSISDFQGTGLSHNDANDIGPPPKKTSLNPIAQTPTLSYGGLTCDRRHCQQMPPPHHPYSDHHHHRYHSEHLNHHQYQQQQQQQDQRMQHQQRSLALNGSTLMNQTFEPPIIAIPMQPGQSNHTHPLGLTPCQPLSLSSTAHQQLHLHHQNQQHRVHLQQHPQHQQQLTNQQQHQLLVPDHHLNQALNSGLSVDRRMELHPNASSKTFEQYLEMKSSNSVSQDWLDNICRDLIEHMNRFGICVIDNFLGGTKGQLILNEVLQLYNRGQYSKGKLVSDKLNSLGDNSGVIRNDRVIWVDGCEDGCSEINNLIQTLCSVITNSASLSLYTNKGLDKVLINKRTKAHVACYPGNGTRYIKHVDNPNRDGRMITSIYYLNKDWNTKRDGGLLRMFPSGMNEIANIEPLFDRALFFWSDRRNPHEVLPAYKDRFAITVWYIGEERL